MEKIRIDKFLWAIRLFKTRTAATTACNAGKVKIDGVNIKPSRLIQVGDVVKLRHNYQYLTIRAEKLIAKRVGAPIAKECYTDITPERDKVEIHKSAFYNKERRERGAGRPTKRERRDLEKYKDDDPDNLWD